LIWGPQKVFIFAARELQTEKSSETFFALSIPLSPSTKSLETK
jgi:hypothetical protein